MDQETLWNNVTLLQPGEHFRLSTDSVACAWFARFAKHDRIADLGCGSGAIALMLLASDPTLTVTGIELQPEAAKTAKKNAAENKRTSPFPNWKNVLPQPAALNGRLTKSFFFLL